MAKNKIKKNEKINLSKIYEEETERHLKVIAKVERQLKVIKEVGQEPITESNCRNKLEWQEQELAIRTIVGKEMWIHETTRLYERLFEKLNPEGQEKMIIFHVFLTQTDFKKGVTEKHVFKQLENWGYAKYIKTEDGKGTVICKKPYTDIVLMPRRIDGDIHIDKFFVISNEVAKKLEEYYKQQDKKNKLF